MFIIARSQIAGGGMDRNPEVHSFTEPRKLCSCVLFKIKLLISGWLSGFTVSQP